MKKSKTATRSAIAPQKPFVGEWWFDTDNNSFYVWVGQWMKVANGDDVETDGESFDPLEAYDRVKGIL